MCPIKIGVTTNHATRLHDLQTGNPRKIEFFAKFSFRTEERAYLVERKMHSYFEDDQLQGEWFDVDPQDLVLKYMLYSAIEIETHRKNIARKAKSVWSLQLVLGRDSFIIAGFIKAHKNGRELYDRLFDQAQKDKSFSEKTPRWMLQNSYDVGVELSRPNSGLESHTQSADAACGAQAQGDVSTAPASGVTL